MKVYKWVKTRSIHLACPKAGKAHITQHNYMLSYKWMKTRYLKNKLNRPF